MAQALELKIVRKRREVDREVAPNRSMMLLLQIRSIARSLERKRNYLRWRIRHPFRPFADYYLQVVSRKLDGGRLHSTLGSRSRCPEPFRHRARLELEFLRRNGLQPFHTVIDYGCGSLRLGRHLLEFLDPDRYFAADITDRFYLDGLRTLDPELIRARRPAFQRLSPSGREALRAVGADVIVSTDVLLHVPARDLDEFLAAIFALMKPGARAFLSFRQSPRYVRTAEVTWAYPPEWLREKAQRLGAKARILSIPEVESTIGERDYRILGISREDEGG